MSIFNGLSSVTCLLGKRLRYKFLVPVRCDIPPSIQPRYLSSHCADIICKQLIMHEYGDPEKVVKMVNSTLSPLKSGEVGFIIGIAYFYEKL